MYYRRNGAASACILIIELVLATATNAQTPPADPVVGSKNFLSGYAAMNEDGTVNVVVEIPAGTNAKWGVASDGESIEWEIRDGRPRVVEYLAYPANYGMIPRTLLPKAAGGDGDPLDVVLLGRSVPRGSVISARVIAVLRLLDEEERDDKVIAVASGGPLGNVESLEQLDHEFPGITSILEIWFSSYDGRGVNRSRGFEGREEALSVVRMAAEAYAGRQ